jgi:peptidoglycan/LPS O-acetylase OafA/YrhL
MKAMPETSHARFDPIVRSEMPELDTIRGTAILMVLFYHGYFWSGGLKGLTGIEKAFVEITRPGWLGVNLFFVLSGFLITGILLDSKSAPHYFRRFYTRRALRILPAYYGILLVLLFYGLRPRSFLALSFFYLSNVTVLFGVKAAYPVLWSLAVEEHFYLLWPAVVHKLSSWAVERCALGIVCVVPLLRAGSFLLGWTDGLSAFTWLVADGLAMGAWLAATVRRPEFTRRQLVRISSAAMGLAISATFLGARFGILTREKLLGATFQETCGNLAFLGVLGFFLLIGTSESKSLVQRPVMSFFGYISYGLYLVHLLVFQIYDQLIKELPFQFPAQAGRFEFTTLRFVVCVAISTALAFLSRRYFEAPFLRMKNRFEVADPARVHGRAGQHIEVLGAPVQES